MIFIFGDLAFLLMVVLTAGLGTVMVFSDWLLDHLAVISCVLALKSLLVFQRFVSRHLPEIQKQNYFSDI